MRENKSLSNKCKCRTCEYDDSDSEKQPCLGCAYTNINNKGFIGTNHVLKKDDIMQEINLLKQRIEQLEFDRLTSCMCRNKIVVAKDDELKDIY